MADSGESSAVEQTGAPADSSAVQKNEPAADSSAAETDAPTDSSAARTEPDGDANAAEVCPPAKRQPSRWIGATFLALAFVVGAALAEGWVAARSGAADGLSLLHSLQAGYFTAGFALVLAIPAAIACGALASARAVRGLGRGLRDGLGGGTEGGVEGHFTAALVGGLAVGGAAALGAAKAGFWMGERLSPKFATVGTIIVALGLIVGLAPVAALIGTHTGRFLRSLRERGGVLGALQHPALLIGIGAALVSVVLGTLLPAAYVPAPTMALAALAVASTTPVLTWVSARLDLRRAAVVCGAAWLVVLPAPFVVEATQPAVQETIRYRPPHVSLLISMAHRFLDGDGDGYAGALMGGDCDDGDPAVNPGAREVAANGIDEDCSGKDAEVYVPPTEPVHARPDALPDRSNIVLIHVEALRPDRMAWNDYHRDLTPNLDAFRADATLFTRAYTPAPSTRFAMASLLTGMDATHLPVAGGRGNAFTLKPEAETVAERLKRVGYDTFGLTISYVLQHNRGTGQGFRKWITPWPVDDWAKIYGKAAPLTTDAAIDYLASPVASEKPWLLHTHYRCPHDPYIKHAEWDFGDEDADKYDSSIAFCDRHVGRLLDALAARPDYERTAIFIYSDHGELFGEHGLTNHGNSVYELDTRVVLLGRIPGGTVRQSDAPVRLTDIGATMLELGGVKPGAPLDGWSLVPLAYEAEPPKEWFERPIFLFTDIWRGTVRYRLAALVVWPWKLIRNRETGRLMFFDLDQDPDEVDDLVAEHESLVEQMDALLEAWIATSMLPD